MKIEIDFEEVEALKKDLDKKIEEIKTLESKLASLDEDFLKKRAVRVSKELFDEYMAAVFKELGFTKEWQRNSVVFQTNLEHWLGPEWYKSEELKITLNAHITSEFKAAFLALDVLTKEITDTP